MATRVWGPASRRAVWAALLLCGAFAGAPGGARAGIIDPTGDFLSTYGGRHNGDLDVVAADVRYDGTNFYLHAVLNGAVGTSNGAIYVWGFNRGAGTAGFTSIGITGVLFDRVIVLNNNDTSTTAGVTVTHSGNEIFAVVPVSLPVMASTGFLPENYTWNLWPRDPLFASGNAAISDFAPDNSNAPVTPTPEPGTLTLAGIGVLGLVGFARRRLTTAAVV